MAMEGIMSADAGLRFFLREEVERGRKVSEQQASQRSRELNPNIRKMINQKGDTPAAHTGKLPNVYLVQVLFLYNKAQ